MHVYLRSSRGFKQYGVEDASDVLSFFLSRLRLIEIVHPCKFLQKPDAAEREYIWKNCRFRMHFTEERNITCTQVARALIMQLLPHITLHRNNADSESINCQWC